MASRKSVNQHVADGTYKAYRHGHLRPGRLGDELQAPPHLTDAEAASFDLAVKYLTHAGVSLSYVDTFRVERMAMALVDAHEARRLRSSLESPTHKTNYSEHSIHPYVKLERDAWAAFHEASKGFGMNPMEREQLAHGDVPDEDPLDELDRKRRERSKDSA